jgi:hypothetical protein
MIHIKLDYSGAAEVCCWLGFKVVAFETAAEFSCVTDMLKGILFVTLAIFTN